MSESKLINIKKIIELEKSGKFSDIIKLLESGKFDLCSDFNKNIFLERAKNYLGEVVEQSSTVKDKSYIERTKEQLISGNFKKAYEEAKLAIKFDSQNQEAYKYAEIAAVELGKFEEAKNIFLSRPHIKRRKTPLKRTKNPLIPNGFNLPSIVGEGNNYDFILEKAKAWKKKCGNFTKKVSVIIPVYNRQKILANTLAALTHQTYPSDLIEIIVVDDGSDDGVAQVIQKYESKLNLFYARQSDQGFRVAAARNLGLKLATADTFITIDADILPGPTDIERYMIIMHVFDMAVLIGHRRYVDTSSITDDEILDNISKVLLLDNISPNNEVADCKGENGKSIDWRFPIYEKTKNLKTDLWPFTKGAGGNLAFSKALLEKSGLFDEEFKEWGCEDGEFCYRMYNSGAYFIPMKNIISLHQEPINKSKLSEREEQNNNFRSDGLRVTKKLFSEKCPSPIIREFRLNKINQVPKVSIYIPAYNAEKYIIDAVESCLKQDMDDLEVCICNDGSTDKTLELLQKHYTNNKKVRWNSQKNKGIGAATNQAINMTRGMYIGQLDSDDILKPGAIRKCVNFLDYNDFDAVYADYDIINANGEYIRDGWCGGDFNRSFLLTGMIVTHFRMFRKRLWARAENCNEQIKNAVDLDLWLKLSEKGKIHHIHDILYSYRWHGSNTSLLDRKKQELNHIKVVNDSFVRLGLNKKWQVVSANNPLDTRQVKIVRLD